MRMLSVLIVDDEEDIGQMVSLILKPHAQLIKYCSTIEKATKVITNQSYDLIFLDLNLEDGTGFELLELMDQTNYNANVVIISAYDGEEEESKARHYNVSSFIKKPFTKSDIINAYTSLTK